eukprot:Selendium_serpulae@DN5056_c0_g1_i1.p1
MTARDPVVAVKQLSYTYPGNRDKSLDDVSLTIDKGSRVIVVGGNGAGKSTLLAILGGKKIVPKQTALVLGREAFHDTALQEQVAYMGDWWKNDFFMDIPVRQVLNDHVGSERFHTLADALEVNLDWRVARMSDGQRRRVQLLAHLAVPKSVYLMDEVTSDLDLVCREKISRMLLKESETRGATVIYATHIFDNLDGWGTHILYLNKGRVQRYCPTTDLPQLSGPREANLSSGSPLYCLVRDWLFAEPESRAAAESPP